MNQPTSQALTTALEVLQWARRSEQHRYEIDLLNEAIDILDLHLEVISDREAREHDEHHERELSACQEFRREEIL